MSGGVRAKRHELIFPAVEQPSRLDDNHKYLDLNVICEFLICNLHVVKVVDQLRMPRGLFFRHLSNQTSKAGGYMD